MLGCFRQCRWLLSAIVWADGLHHAKICRWHMYTVKAQSSMHVYTIWSEPLLYTNRIIGYFRMYEWRAKTHVLCACTGKSESDHFAHVRSHFFAWHSPYNLNAARPLHWSSCNTCITDFIMPPLQHETWVDMPQEYAVHHRMGGR